MKGHLAKEFFPDDGRRFDGTNCSNRLVLSLPTNSGNSQAGSPFRSPFVGRHLGDLTRHRTTSTGFDYRFAFDQGFLSGFPVPVFGVFAWLVVGLGVCQ